jgi:hypothetical protein
MGAVREKHRGHMPEIRKNITITKLDAAKRQLETVVRLYFHNGDPVSIHTLVAAAHTVTRNINEKRRGSPMIKDDLIDAYAKPDYQKRVLVQLNEAENFFKHADRDHAATLDFNPDESEIWMLDAIRQYQRLTGEETPLFGVFIRWYMINNQELFDELPKETKLFLTKSKPRALGLGKSAFFNLILPALMRQGI